MSACTSRSVAVAHERDKLVELGPLLSIDSKLDSNLTPFVPVTSVALGCTPK